MTNFYSVLQYVDDPVSDERVNVGVFAFCDQAARFVPTGDWSKVRCLAGSTAVVRIKAALRDLARWTPQDINAFLTDPYGDFNLTPPSASILGKDELLFYIAGRVLPDREERQPTHRVRSDVVTKVRATIRGRLKERFGPRGRALIWDSRRQIVATPIPTNPDVTLGNGRPVQIVQALSFEEREARKISRDVTATGYLIKAIREAEGPISQVPIAVVCTAPKPELNDYYRRAVDEFRASQADVVSEAEIDRWTAITVEQLQVHQ